MQEGGREGIWGLLGLHSFILNLLTEGRHRGCSALHHREADRVVLCPAAAMGQRLDVAGGQLWTRRDIRGLNSDGGGGGKGDRQQYSRDRLTFLCPVHSGHSPPCTFPGTLGARPWAGVKEKVQVQPEKTSQNRPRAGYGHPKFPRPCFQSPFLTIPKTSEQTFDARASVALNRAGAPRLSASVPKTEQTEPRGPKRPLSKSASCFAFGFISKKYLPYKTK